MTEQTDISWTGDAAIAALMARFSSWPLHEPAPSAAELDVAFELAMRAPDHGGMQPWRFVTIQGSEARAAFADVLVEAARARGHDDPERYRRKTAAAPLTIVPAVRLVESVKVPAIEQWLAAGAAVMNLLNALFLQGYGAIWVSGPNAFDPRVRDALGFAADEHLLGFVHVGTAEASARSKARPDHAPFVRAWHGAGR